MSAPFLMFLDVESIGLHGEGFAVGWVVINEAGQVVESELCACAPEQAHGQASDRQWVAEHVPALTVTHANPAALRAAFWQRWLDWRGQGAQMVAYCPWPVEARFLTACVDELGPAAHWHGPYPLLDVCSRLHAAGQDPLQPLPRREDEKPEHDPLADVRYAIRRWRECA